MNAAGLSQRDVADQSGVALATLSRRLRSGDFTVRELDAIAGVLDPNLRASDLLAEAEALAVA